MRVCIRKKHVLDILRFMTTVDRATPAQIREAVGAESVRGPMRYLHECGAVDHCAGTTDWILTMTEQELVSLGVVE